MTVLMVMTTTTMMMMNDDVPKGTCNRDYKIIESSFESSFELQLLDFLLDEMTQLVRVRVRAEMEPSLRVTSHRSPGHRVSYFGRVGSGQGSMCQTRCMTRF